MQEMFEKQTLLYVLHRSLSLSSVHRQLGYTEYSAAFDDPDEKAMSGSYE